MMQKNTKALIVFGSIVAVLFLVCFVLIYISIQTGQFKFFFKVYTFGSEKIEVVNSTEFLNKQWLCLEHLVRWN
jgi:hypothetical protein